jgi:hypothetical protein
LSLKDREIRPSINRRATGARKYPLNPDVRESEDGTEIDQRAAANKPPKGGYGLTQPLDETSEELSQSDNLDQRSRPNLADDKTKKGVGDGDKVAGGQEYEIQHLMRTAGISRAQAMALIKRFGNDRETLEREARKLA